MAAGRDEMGVSRFESRRPLSLAKPLELGVDSDESIAAVARGNRRFEDVP